MPIIFPPLTSASPEGLLAIGGELNYQTLYAAYTNGIFPWPISDKSLQMTWFSPNPRGVLYTTDFHMSKSFQKFLKKTKFTIRFNTQFLKVIQSCSKIPRAHEAGTWINDEIIQGFHGFFNEGHSYSVEVYNPQQELIGGLYGVIIGKYISGESMFHTETNASKLAISALIYKIKQKNIPFVDTQMVTPILESFGAKEVSRDKFIQEIQKLNQESLTRDDLFPPGEVLTPDQLVD